MCIRDRSKTSLCRCLCPLFPGTATSCPESKKSLVMHYKPGFEYGPSSTTSKYQVHIIVSKEKEVYLPVANNSRLVPARLLPLLFAGESEENDLHCNHYFAVFGRAEQASLALDVFPISISTWVLRFVDSSKSIKLLCARAVPSVRFLTASWFCVALVGTSNVEWRDGGPLYLYKRYSSCRYNERQLIDVTVVRRVRPRAERWCDCEGHRRWKRAGRTLFCHLYGRASAAERDFIGYPRRR